MSARVAVIVPCFGDGPLLAEAVRSVVEPEPVELVVVDDGSTDEATLDVLAELEREGHRVVRHERNRGVPAARGTGLAATSAPYVFPLDADDHAVPGALTRLADTLDANPDAGVAFGDYEDFGDHEAVVRAPASLDPYRIAYRMEFGPSLFRRSALEAVGGWDPPGAEGKVFGYEDWHVWMGLAERGYRGVHVGPGEVVYRRRFHGERRMTRDRRRHRAIYRTLRALHPDLFASLAEHRRRTTLSSLQARVYPLLYGGRPRFGFEPRLRAALSRLRARGG